MLIGDGHAHIYPHFDLALALDSLLENLRNLAKSSRMDTRRFCWPAWRNAGSGGVLRRGISHARRAI